MTIHDQNSDEKLQYDINSEPAKISALSYGKFDKYEHLMGEEILTSNQKQIVEQPKFTYSPLCKPFEKQIKRIEDQGEKQIHLLEEQWVKSDELAKKDFNIDRKSIPLEEQKIFNEIIK